MPICSLADSPLETSSVVESVARVKAAGAAVYLEVGLLVLALTPVHVGLRRHRHLNIIHIANRQPAIVTTQSINNAPVISNQIRVMKFGSK